MGRSRRGSRALDQDGHRCRWCAGRLGLDEEVRLVFRELVDDEGLGNDDARWAYTHLGHEPGGYAVISRGRVRDLEALHDRARRVTRR
jgi:hypothetical protein